MRRPAVIWRLHVALAAALLLLTATVSGAFAGAAASFPVLLDAFGNPICTSHSGHGDAAGHPSLPACCTLACAMGSPALADASPAGDLIPGLHALPARMPADFSAEIRPPAADYDPGRPRAPPLA